jgi:nicotinate-nucleotide pyrophosphorylase (carboxylating)
MLIRETQMAQARVITRERAIIAGKAWVEEVFRQVDPSVQVIWRINEGEWVRENQVLFELKGKARSLLTGERCALNYLQTLSATATLCRRYADQVAGTGVKLLDTRKTLPGLRVAQKYAVTVGGCFNHRMGLYDAFLIKENQRIAPGKPVEVEVETLDEMREAIQAQADIVMLDNFSPEAMTQAVRLARSLSTQVKLEASGNINDQTLLPYAQTGVDYISIGALTKDCKAIDLSMRLV